MTYEILVAAGVLTIGGVLVFMGGFGWFIYRDSHRKDKHKN